MILLEYMEKEVKFLFVCEQKDHLLMPLLYIQFCLDLVILCLGMSVCFMLCILYCLGVWSRRVESNEREILVRGTVCLCMFIVHYHVLAGFV